MLPVPVQCCSSPAGLCQTLPQCPVPAPLSEPPGGGSGWACGLGGRKVRGGAASAWLVRFPSPELGSAFHVSRFRRMQRRELGLRGCRGSCWQAWAAGEGGRGAASAGRGAPTVQTGWAAAASRDQPAASLLALLVLRQCGAGVEVSATIQSHFPWRIPGQESCCVSATCWPWPGPGDVFCAGEVGAGILAGGAPGLRSTGISTGAGAAGRELSCCSRTTDRD